MSLTALVWLVMFFGFAIAAFTLRPIYSMPVYFMSFWSHPAWWWWGRQAGLTYYRWAFYGGLVALFATMLAGAYPFKESDKLRKKALFWVVLALINVLFVHFVLAPQAPLLRHAFKPFKLYLKFALLFSIMVAVIRSRRDFMLVCMTLTLGASYWGYEIYVNDRGTMRAGRLEGLGGPGATDANHMASAIVTVLPLVGGLLFTDGIIRKVVVAMASALIVNNILLCNSRGAFLSVIFSGFVLVSTARGKLRKKAFLGVILGGTCAFMLMGDPEILERFLSTFVSGEERDGAATSRLLFWQAGFKMLKDYPFGAGGDGFKRAGGKYMDTSLLGANRSVHNGYINEACEWGYQGLVLHLMFIFWCCLACYRTMDYQRQPGGDEAMAFFGSCTLAAMGGWLGTCFFGDYMDNEWGWWVCALCLAYSRNYGPPNENRKPKWYDRLGSNGNQTLEHSLETAR